MARIRARHVCSPSQLQAFGAALEMEDSADLSRCLLQIDRSARALKLFHLAALARDCEHSVAGGGVGSARPRLAALLAVLEAAAAGPEA